MLVYALFYSVFAALFCPYAYGVVYSRYEYLAVAELARIYSFYYAVYNHLGLLVSHYHLYLYLRQKVVVYLAAAHELFPAFLVAAAHDLHNAEPVKVM